MIVQPRWVEIMQIGSRWEVEIDVRAPFGSATSVVYRHRERAFSGQQEQPWIAGRPPE